MTGDAIADGGRHGERRRRGAQPRRRSCSRPGRFRAAVGGIEFGGRVIGTEEAWAFPSCRRGSRSSAPAPRGPRSPPPTRGSGPRRTSSRSSTGCFRPRTRRSRRSSCAGSRARASRSTPHTVRERRERRRRGQLQRRRRARRGRLARARRGPQPGRLGALGLDAAGIALTSAGSSPSTAPSGPRARAIYAIGDYPGAPRSRTRPPTRGSSRSRRPPGSKPTRSSTSTSPARPSACPTSASFGLTEAQAREQGHDVVIGKVPYGAVGAGTVYGDRSGHRQARRRAPLRRAARRPHRRRSARPS